MKSDMMNYQSASLLVSCTRCILSREDQARKVEISREFATTRYQAGEAVHSAFVGIGTCQYK